MSKKSMVDDAIERAEIKASEEMEDDDLDLEVPKESNIDVDKVVADLIKVGKANGNTVEYDAIMNKLDASLDVDKIEQVYQKLNEEYHVYGMLWEPDGYTLYLDGKPRGPKIGMEEGEAVSQVPEFLLISTEGHNFRQNNCTGSASAELVKAYEAGDAFIVDYVRVYDIAE